MDSLRLVTHADNVKLGEDGASVVIIDQTKLPGKTEYLTLRTAKDLYDAIYELKVRGRRLLESVRGLASMCWPRRSKVRIMVSSAGSFGNTRTIWIRPGLRR